MNEGKLTHLKRPVGHHQVDHHIYYGNPKRRRKREGNKRIFEKTMLRDFTNLIKKDNNLHIQVQ